MSLLEQFLSGAHLEAIASMLFHSIWQGAVLAGAAGIILLLTKKSAAVLRYNLLVTLLCVFAAGTLYTYWSHLPAKITNEAIESIAVTQQSDENQKVASGFISGTARLFHSNAPLIVSSWLMLIFIRLCFLMTGYYKVNRFRKKYLIPPPHEWTERWKMLVNRMNIQAPVQLMESALAKVPMVIGHFRPLVLVPAGMLMSLPPDEAEAILLHELAHIKRRDYLLNLLQQALECIFFFHPAVRWVCSLISEEREHCCDDIAASHNKDKRTYINALVSFYEHSLPPVMAASFGGRKRNMIDRIKRLINHRNKTLNVMEKIFLTIALVVAGFLVHAYYNTEPKIGRQISQQVTDTVPKNEVRAEWTENGKRYRAIFRDNKLDELYADGKKIPREKYHEHQSVIDRMMQDKHQAELDAERAEHDAEEARQDAEEARKEAQEDIERAREELENSSEERDRDRGRAIINEREIKEMVADIMRDTEEALRDLREEGKTSEEIREELRSALQNAQQGLKQAQEELKAAERGQRGDKSVIENVQLEKELMAVTEQAVQLGLQAAQIGIREAQMELNEVRNENHDYKMDKKEYRQRMKMLREEYRNSQRSRQD